MGSCADPPTLNAADRGDGTTGRVSCFGGSLWVLLRGFVLLPGRIATNELADQLPPGQRLRALPSEKEGFRHPLSSKRLGCRRAGAWPGKKKKNPPPRGRWLGGSLDEWAPFRGCWWRRSPLAHICVPAGALQPAAMLRSSGLSAAAWPPR